MISSEAGNDEDAEDEGESSHSHQQQQPSQGISGDNFRQLLVDIAEWYDGLEYFNMLKVLYKDHVNDNYKLNMATKTMDLLRLLIGYGDLSSTNLTILYDTVKSTGQFGFEPKNKNQFPPFQNVRDLVSTFTRHRQKILKLGMALTQDDVEKLDEIYNLPRVKKYEDCWSLIMDLECRMKLGEGKMEDFIEVLQRNEISLAINALLDGNDEEAGYVGESSHSHQQQQSSQENQLKILEEANKARQRKKLLKQGIAVVGLLCIIIGIIIKAFLEPSPTPMTEPIPKPSPEQSIDDVIREDFIERQKKMYENVTRMTPSNWNNEYKIDINQVFTELDLLKSKKEDEGKHGNPAHRERAANSTTLKEVLGVINSTVSCKVLITGEGGMGKTTLLRYIAHSWATNSDDTFAGKLLFLINIRDIKEGENFLDAIMQKINMKQLIEKKNLSKDSIERFLRTHDYEIVLLLDGFDELQSGAENPIRLFEDYDLQEYTVILTSRPENTIDFAESCDVHVKVKGFNPMNIKNYIHKHFYFFNEVDLGESLIQAFKLDSENKRKWGGDHKDAFELCSSPYLLIMICTMWRENQHIPKDLPELYKGVFCTILNQYIKRSDKGTTISDFDRIPKKYESAILTIGECMYTSLLVNKISIDRYDIKPEDDDPTIVDLALKIGFVYQEKPEAEYDLKDIYTTPHKLLSEALAGFYISTKCQKEHFKDNEYDIIRTNKYLHMTRAFAVGFLGSDAGKLLKHLLKIKTSNYYLLASYFKYVQTEHQQTVLRALNKNISTDVKEHVEDMTNSFIVYFGQDTLTHTDGHIETLINIFYDIENNNCKFAMDTSKVLIKYSEYSSKIICRMIAHISLMFQVGLDQQLRCEDKYFLEIVKMWGDEAIKVISTEWEKHNLNDEVHNLIFDNYDAKDINGAQLYKVLKMAPKLNILSMSSCRLSGTIVNTMISKCQYSPVLLELTIFDMSYNNLDDIDVVLLSNLLKMAYKLEILHMDYCNLTVTIVGDMLNRCDRMGVKLKDNMISLKGNNLSSIDGETIAKLGSVLYISERTITWSDYHLSASNLLDLINSCGKNCRFKLNRVNLNDVDLSSFSGSTLANLFNIFPDLTSLYMRNCNLTCNIVGDMLNECDRIGVVLKDNTFLLGANDLSDIDGKSLVKLLNVFFERYLYIYQTIAWSDYNLSAGNLQDLLNSCGENDRIKWNGTINLSNVNLALINGSKLATLYKIFPMIDLEMRNCSLTGNIVSDMLNACDRMGVVLINGMASLQGNDLSSIDGESLVKLVNIFSCKYCRSLTLNEYNIPESLNLRMFSLTWSDYYLSAGNLEDLVNSCGKKCRFKWNEVNLSDINLSSISGSTLANLFNIFPDLTSLYMRNCNLTGNIVGDMLNECDRIGVVLKDNTFLLGENDLSDIDGKSLVKLLNVVFERHLYIDQTMYFLQIITWSNYNLSAGNLEDLVKSCGKNCIFKWKEVNLSYTNLSSISGSTLANLFNMFPNLTRLYMSNCNLTGKILNDTLNECDRMGVVLKDFVGSLDGNNFTNIYGESLVLIK